MFLRLLLLFTLVPTLEVFLLISLGRNVGFGVTLMVVLGTGVLGAWLARREGLKVLAAVQSEINQGRMPTEHMLDGLLILLAGAVLLTPGFLTDGLGFFLLLPVGRRFVRALVSRALSKRIRTPGAMTLEGEWTSND